MDGKLKRKGFIYVTIVVNSQTRSKRERVKILIKSKKCKKLLIKNQNKFGIMITGKIEKSRKF